MKSWTEHVPPTHKPEDCECGALHADEGYASSPRTDIVCPACDGVYVVHVPEEDNA